MIIKEIFSKFKDKLHCFRIQGVFQDQGHFQGLFKVCANSVTSLVPEHGKQCMPDSAILLMTLPSEKFSTVNSHFLRQITFLMSFNSML